jgi:hypothetical protein
VRRGLVSREQVDAAISSHRRLLSSSSDSGEADATTLGAILLRERLLDESQLSDVLFGMILHIISQINQWREGVFAFHPAPDTRFPIRFNVQEVVLDLMRLQDERRQRMEST